jgi:hypothetical protein
MADETIVTAFEVEGQQQVVAAFDEVGKAGAKSFSDIQNSSKSLDQVTDQVVTNVGKMADAFKTGLGQGAANIFKPLQQALDGLTRGGFSKVGESIKNLGSTFTNLGSAVSTFKGTFAGIAEGFAAAAGGAGAARAGVSALAATVGALGPVALAAGAALTGLAVVMGVALAAGLALAKSTAETAVAVRHMSDAAGTTAEKFQELQHAFTQTGSAAGTLPQALAHISSATEQARAAGDTSIGVFKEFGIQLVDTSGNARDAGVVMKEFADKIAALASPAEQASKVMAEFGPRIGKDLVSGLKLGSEGLDAFAADLRALGGEVTDEQIKIADAFEKQSGRASTAWEGTKQRLGAVFQGMFTPLIEGVANAGGALNGLLDTLDIGSGKITEFGEGGKNALTNVASAFKTLEATGKQSISVLDFQKPKESVEGATTAVNAFGETISNIDASQAKEPIVQLGETAKSTFTEIDDAAKTTSNAITDAFKDATGINLTPFFKAWQDGFDQVLGIAKAGAAEIGPAVGQTVTAGIETNVDLKTPFEAKATEAVEAVQTAVASVDLSGISLAAQTEAQAVSDAFTNLDFSTVFSGVVEAAQSVFSQLPAIVTQATAGISTAMKAVAQSITGIFAGPVQQAAAAFSSLSTAAANAGRTVTSAMGNAVTAVNNLKSAADGAAAAFGRMETAARAAAAAARDANAAAAGHADGGAVFSRGGGVWGAGSSTSDSIPAWLSHGEWVIKAAAVKKYGHGLFAMLNSMRFPATAVRDLLRGFSGGGQVDFSPMLGALRGHDRSIPSFASGGPTRMINLSIGGEQFAGLIAPEEVADKLVRYALNEQVRQGGRKPGWYR